SLISQICITHVPLNNHLYRFKHTRCPGCEEPKEMVKHYLLHCPTYTHEQWTLEKAIKCKPDLKMLLGNYKTTLALKNYIKATHRF
ncbi:hypothetical protein BGY98DRAFT_897936, partial [Russula aff. rugulosa BPL654]